MEKHNNSEKRAQRGALSRAELLQLLDDVSAAAESMLLHYGSTMPEADAAQRGQLIFEARDVCDAELRGPLTEARARELALHDRHYVARQNGSGEWIVWDTVSDHRVEF